MAQLDELKREIDMLEMEVGVLDTKIACETQRLAEMNEEVLEAKMQMIAMREISETAFESLVRRMGYVNSIHGYPEKARKTD